MSMILNMKSMYFIKMRGKRIKGLPIHDLPFNNCESSFFKSPLSLCDTVAVIAFGTSLITLPGLLLPDLAGADCSLASNGPLIKAVMLGMILLAPLPALVVGMSLSGGGSENGFEVALADAGGEGGLAWKPLGSGASDATALGACDAA
jgi:hypothetical protein